MQFATQPAHTGQAGFFVVDEEFDARQPLQQLLFALSDHPSQGDTRPGALQDVDQRQDVGHVAQCGQAQQADGSGTVQKNFFTCN